MSIREAGVNLLLLVVSTLVTVLVIEFLFRASQADSSFQAGRELKWLRKTGEIFTVDPAFGFRPKLGTNVYSEFGTRVNSYKLEKSEGVQRLLFIGDSVTNRARIVNALRHQYGDEKYEYWNAGVESFNTIQEYKYLRDYNLGIDPDHVILSFHMNDFETTPVVFYEGDELRVYAPDTRLENSYPWLLQNSAIYRLVLDVTSRKSEEEVLAVRQEIFSEVQDNLESISHLLAGKNIEFTVLVLPYFKPYLKWQPHEKERREVILATLGEMNVPHFDFLDLLEKALENGVEVQETKGDTSHPGDDISAIFAEYLYQQNLFD